MSKKKDAGNPRYAFDSIQFSSLSKPSIPPQPPTALGFTSKMNVRKAGSVALSLSWFCYNIKAGFKHALLNSKAHDPLNLITEIT